MQAGIGSLAASYAARGWKLVRLYGVVEPGVCTCWKGRDCGTPGKHPAGGEGWHLTATSDEEEIMSWFDSGKPVNIGVLLGPRSGVIDVELDGEDAKAAWNDLGLGEIWTPTYTAGRGPHRLFAWNEDLPAVAVKKVLGIEVRIGNDGRAAQSVLPPSTHHTGKGYAWVDGLSPDDVELQPLPEKLVNLLWNDDGTGRRVVARAPAREVLSRPVPEGERNNELYRFAVAEAFRCGPNLDDAREQQDLLLKIRAVNTIQCKPPLNDSEVVALYRSAIGYVRKTRAAGVDTELAMQAAEKEGPQPAPSPADRSAGKPTGWQKVFTETGLSFAPVDPDSESEWGPGEWHLTVVHSDPLEYRLHVPAWKPLTAQGTGNISFSVDQYVSSAKVAKAVLAATGTIILDAEPGKWKRIWDGGYKVQDNKSAQQPPPKRVALGVKAKLLANVSHEWPGASSLRYVLLATWLYDRLSQASQPNDDDVPDPTGRASWRQDGTLWFAWGKVWEDIERQHRVQDGERLALKRRLLAHLPGEKDFRHAEHRHLGGARKSYVVWSRREFAILESMATPDAEPPVI